MSSENTVLFAQSSEASISLSQFIIAINKAVTEQEIYASLACHLPELLPADRCSVTLLNPEDNTLEIFSLHGSEGAMPIGKSLPLNKTGANKAVKGKTSILNILSPDSDLLDTRQLWEQGLKSCINAPLIIEGMVIGTVNIASTSDNLYDENSIALMNLVTTLASTYLQRQKLLERTKYAMLDYQRYAEQLETLNRCASQLSIAFDEEGMFKIIARAIAELMPSKRTSYVTPNHDHTEFSVRQLSETSSSMPVKKFLASQNSIFSHIIKEGKAIFFPSLKDLDYLEPRLLVKAGMVSSWCIPVYINNQVVAIINTATDQPSSHGEKLKDILSTIGSILGAALERINVQKLLRYQAHHDPLTGLANRAQFQELLTVLLANNSTLPFALLFIDLDNFKYINDCLGHDIGDKLLCNVTQRVIDTISDPCLMARLGGDEFIVTLPYFKDMDAIAEIAKSVIEALQVSFDVDGHKLFIGASIGISSHPDHGNNGSDLVKYADIAMYHAKNLGRNNYQFFTQELSQKINHHRYIDDALRQAITNNELNLVFQPLITAERIQGVEALLRWTHPEMGVISPAEFIPIAEESLAIEDITYWVLNQALVTLKQLRRHRADLFIAINISAKMFRNPVQFTQTILDALKLHDLPGSALELEITENVFLGDIVTAKQLLNDLRDNGISVAIDDFGTGFSSLTYLLDLPLDTLKIDQSFVQGVENDKKKLGVVTATLALAKSLELSCIAEGIETEGQKTCLQSLGCERFQGYLFSHPLPAKELLHKLTENLL